MPPEDDGISVFLAHSHHDKEYIRKLDRLLMLDGFRPWLDERNLIAGQKWELEIEEAVQNADAIVVLLSENAIGSDGYLHTELSLALDVAKRQPEGAILIIPIRLGGDYDHSKLKWLHWIDATEVPRMEIDAKVLVTAGLDCGRWPEFSIGHTYTRHREALHLAAKQADTHNAADLGRASGRHLYNEYLIHGRDPNAREYFGRATMEVRQQQLLLRSQVGVETFEYEGSQHGQKFEFAGKHNVSYVMWGQQGLLIGAWNKGGLEELIPSRFSKSQSLP